MLSRTKTALTFDSARQIIFDDLKAISLERREVDKENTKLALQETDPRMADFIIRSRKAREMTKRIRELEEENEELRHALEAMTEQQGKQMRDVLEE